MLHIENVLYEEIVNPEDYEFYLARQCTCNNNWKTIGVEKGVEGKEVLRHWKTPLPTKDIPSKQNVILYSRS
jgi:hypothetical protein